MAHSVLYVRAKLTKVYFQGVMEALSLPHSKMASSGIGSFASGTPNLPKLHQHSCLVIIATFAIGSTKMAVLSSRLADFDGPPELQELKT